MKKNIDGLDVMMAASKLVEDVRKDINEKIKTINWAIVGIVLVVALAFVAIILDQFRFNSVVYREYSNKTEINNILLEENKNNQKLIIELLENKIK